MNRISILSLLLTGLFWAQSSHAATPPAANTSLQVQVTVGIADIIRIEWGAGSSGPAAGTVSTYTWDLNLGGTEYVDLGQARSSDDAVYNIAGTPQAFKIKNGGTHRVSVTAQCSNDTGLPIADRWSLGTSGTNTFEVWLAPDGGAYQQFPTPATTITIKNPLRRTDTPVDFKLRYVMPTDIDKGWSATITHAITVTVTAAGV